MTPSEYLFGWVDDPAECERVVASLERPVFGLAAPDLRGTGAGKTVLLYKAMRTVFGRDLLNKQTTGDCVSQGWCMGVDCLASVEEVIHGEHEHQPLVTATEPSYAAGRVEIGGGRLGRQPGSLGGWQAKAMKQYGTLLRKRYVGGDGASLDLTTYSGDRADEMGMPRAGVPDWIEPVMRQHTVRQVSLVTSYEEARDAIANGHPVPVCSNQGFSNRRDSQGFARPESNWAHCMLFYAVMDESRRPGLLCLNSWGVWNGGPKGEHDIPDGSFWVDADVADRMLRGQDSYAMSAYDGYVKRPDLADWLEGWVDHVPVISA